jgi:cytochrome b subunit of formate dehydrogenase
MNTTSKKMTSNKPQPAHQAEENAEIEKIRAKVRARRLQTARELAKRMQILPDGTRVFIRFNARERFEHQLLIGSFTMLGFTGLLQTFSKIGFVSWIINILLGGIETLRTIHHLAAIIFAIQALYHFAGIIYLWFVKREFGSMWPKWDDIKGLLGMFKFNLNMAKERPAFDRFSIEEKVEYWALLWGTVIMGITGVFQWFPMLVTSLLPGVAIPIARTIHAWEAILAVLSILTWHMYHTLVKENNQSIFTGMMTEEEMQENHAVEYHRIVAAYDFIKKASLKHQNETQEAIEVPHEMVELGTTD